MDIKFQFLYKGAPFHNGTKDFNWHKKVYTLDQLLSCKLSNLCDVHNQSTLVAKRQFIGRKDHSGVDVYDGDIVAYRPPSTPHDQEPSFIILVIEYEEVNTSFRACSDFHGEMPIHEDVIIEVIGNIYQNPELIENNN